MEKETNPYNPYENPYNPYGNPYKPYENPYKPYQSPYQDPYSQSVEEETSSINILAWLMRILHYWYLFVIAALIAFCCAYLKNRKWLPKQLSTASIIIQQSTRSVDAALMNGFDVGRGYSNVTNQMVMLGSYDLTARVIDSIPFLNVEYIQQGRFKTRNLYRSSPILLEYESIAPIAYGMLFKCSFRENGELLIESTNEDIPFSQVVHYGDRIESSLFTATIWPTENMAQSGHVIYFRFRDRASLVDEFLSRLTFEFIMEKSTVLRCSLVSEVPERDCEFLDKLLDIYLLQNLERKNKVAENSIRFINEQLKALQGSLQVSEGAMTKFRQENKFVDVNSYAGELMGKISSYDQENMALRLKETYLNYLDNYLHQQIEQGAVVAPASLGVNDPMLTQFVTQMNTLQLQRSELSPKNAYYAKYTADIENVKNGLREVIKTMRASLEIERSDLNTRFADVERDIQKLPTKELEMVAIERNYRIDDNYYTFFLQKRAEAEIQKASNMPDNDIMDRARTSVITNLKDKKKTTAIYLVVGLLIPLVLIILSELLNDKIRTPNEADTLSDFHLIGTLRHAKNPNPTLAKANPRSRYSEMLRSIRTRIEFIVKKKVGISVCVTSTESGDGKTFLSSNLAALYAMSGKKTILLDVDIRKPNLHIKLGLDSGMGISNYLIGDCTLDDIILKDVPFDFDFVRAGTVPPNPGELLHSDKMTEMLEILRERYDYIVIDSSPIGQVPDAYSLIEQTDTTLFVIRCLQTSKSFCRQTLEQLAVDHKEKIHLILSDIPTEGYHHGYNYGYAYNYGARYGYGYGKKGYGHYGYGYGRYGYGAENNKWYKYGLYGKLLHRHEHKKQQNYYMDDDE